MIALWLREAFLRGRVLDELDAVEVASAADVPDELQIVERLELVPKGVLVLKYAARQVLAFQDFDVRQSNCAADGVAGVGNPVHEGFIRIDERLGETIAYDRGSKRRISRRQALRASDDVGLIVVPVACKHVAEPTEGADGLVGYQQHAVAIADLAHALEIRGWRYQAATCVLDGLDEEGRNGFRPFRTNDALDVVRAGLRQLFALLPLQVCMCVAGVEGTRRQRRIEIADLGYAGDGERTKRRPVVGDIARDDLVAVGLAGRAEVLFDELPGGLHGVAAPAPEEDTIEIAGRQGRELRRELDRGGMREGPEREEVKLVRLLVGGVCDFFPAVADIRQEEAGQTVDVSLAVVVEDVAAVSARDDRVVGRIAERRETRPQVPARQPRQLRLRVLLRHFVPPHLDRSDAQVDKSTRDAQHLGRAEAARRAESRG